ncbi:MAG: glutathione S-transferase [Pseudomonadales bacterium]|nr:glutathione S-transferase [Halioglobus sp.]MCP5131308.1 glutathione S-transferase [Pseudomonadales bacterium]
MTVDYYLYGGDHSLYTGKARAYMRFKGLNWEEVTATRELYKSIILPNVGAAIVPVLATADGRYIQDTTDIIDYLEAAHPAVSVYPDTPVQKLVALMLELYGDEWLVIPAMHYRWSVLDQQREFIFLEFGKMSAPDAARDEQLRIGERTSTMFRGSVTALGITEQTMPAIEQVYLEFLDQLDAHFSQYDYLLGSRPGIGDFGLIGPLYAHLGRDPVPKALMQERAPNVYAWVQRMNNPVPLAGDFLADDEIPVTLLPILRTMCRDQLPDVLDVIRHNAAWLEQNPGGNIPRYLGMHPFRTGSASGERVIHSYAQWMFQRPWAHYHSLAGAQRLAADKLLQAIGGYEALNTDIGHWVQRKAGQLELVEGKR